MRSSTIHSSSYVDGSLTILGGVMATKPTRKITTMNKIQYELVALEVEKLYGKIFPPDAPNKEVEDHCEYIAKYIESCGWDTDDYMSEYIRRAAQEYLEPLPKPAIDIRNMN